MKRSLQIHLIAASLVLSGAVARAHEVRPAYLELTERAKGEFDVLWKVPALGGAPLARQLTRDTLTAHIAKSRDERESLLLHVIDREEQIEQCGEVLSLRGWLDELRHRPPQNELERLRFALAEAIRIEDYETAARVRDQLRRLQASET